MHDHDDIDFGMLDLPTRPGPAKASAAPETDMTAHLLEIKRTGLRFVNLQREADMAYEYRRQTHASMGKSGPYVEVKHGSGKVKV